MNPSDFILFCGDPWRLCDTANPRNAATPDWHPPAEASPADLAQSLRQWFDEQHIENASVLLALPSDWVYSAAIDTDGLPRRHQRAAWAYRLESQLPLAAEEFVADYIPSRHGALAVAIPISRIKPLLDALTEQSIRIPVITPLATLFIPPPEVKPSENTASVDLLLQADAHHADLFLFREGVPIVWRYPDRRIAALQREIDMLCLTAVTPPQRALAHGLNSEELTALRQHTDIDITARADHDPVTAVAATAADILQGKTEPWINLRRDALSDSTSGGVFGNVNLRDGPYRFAALALLTLTLCLIAAFGWRGLRYQWAADAAVQRQTHAFQLTFPNQSIPGGIRSRMESEQQRLLAISGADGRVPRTPSALTDLYELMQRLPKDLRFRLLELQLENHQLTLDGQVRSHGDAEALVAALRQTGTSGGTSGGGGGFEMEPPRTETLASGAVGFSTHGKRIESPSTAKAIQLPGAGKGGRP